VVEVFRSPIHTGINTRHEFRASARSANMDSLRSGFNAQGCTRLQVKPRNGSKEYNDLVEALYFTNEFKRRGGRASLFRWGITTSEQLQELKALGKDVGIDRFVTTFSYPGDYSVRRESAIGNY
jgi:hypothetical protein